MTKQINIPMEDSIRLKTIFSILLWRFEVTFLNSSVIFTKHVKLVIKFHQ